MSAREYRHDQETVTPIASVWAGNCSVAVDLKQTPRSALVRLSIGGGSLRKPFVVHLRTTEASTLASAIQAALARIAGAE